MTLSGIFAPAQFSRERRFLKFTLITFTLSYCVAVGRSFAIYTMIHLSTFQIKVWMCKNNFTVNLINFLSFICIDIIPYFTIFFLHWKNFRYEEQRETIDESIENDKSRSNRETVASNTATKNQSFIGRHPAADIVDTINDGQSYDYSTHTGGDNKNFKGNKMQKYYRTYFNDDESEEEDDDDRHFSKVLLHMADGDDDDWQMRKSTIRKISQTQRY